MPKIEDLVLSVSRNSLEKVSVKVAYTATLTQFESAVRALQFAESIKLYKKRGTRDDVADPHSNDYKDVLVATWTPNTPFNASDAVNGKVARSFEHELTSTEVDILRVSGRESPYVIVEVHPFRIDTDSKLAEVRDIDIGDPGEPNP